MIGTLIAGTLATGLLAYYYKKAYARPDNFPPGPPSLPLYGSYWIILANGYNNLANAMFRLSKQYRSNILGMYLGKVPLVVVNDSSLVKEVLLREDFDGRMDLFLARLRSYWKKLGIFFTDGYFWFVQRRFTLRFMRDFGFGRRDETLEAVIEHELKEMIDMRVSGPMNQFEKEIVNGELVYLPHYFAVPFINGILHVLCRKTLPRSEYNTLWDLARGALTFQRSSNDLGGALTLTPWLRDILPNFSGYKGLRTGNQYLLDFFEKLLAETMASHEDTYERHFLDMYLNKMKEEKQAAKRSTFSVDQLVLVCTDYMFPTASAVQSVLTMLVERLLLQPEIQDKIHEEIDRVVGRNRMPNLDDRKNMPYTEACIREIMRFETLVPLGVPHRAQKDTKLGGYDVPEGTMVSTNLVALHMDKEIWGDPENFRPERFITNGQLNVSKDKSLPFGAGHRLCAGETYARQGMFQVFAGFMQAFHVSTADGKPLTKPAERIQGIITTLPNFWIKVMPRN